MISKKLLIVSVALAMASTQFAIAIPNPDECRQIGGSGAPAPGASEIAHTYDLDTAGALTVVYDQCLQHLIDDLASGGAIAAYNEYGAGIDGAAFASVGSTNPYGDSRLGGTVNCWGGNFTAHHGTDDRVNTADSVQGGNIRVFITSDLHDVPGETVLNQTGQDIRDPCGDNSIDAVDNFIVVDPCGGLAAPPCSPSPWNWYTFDTSKATRASSTFNESGRSSVGATLGDNAGLDGGIWTFIGISTGNASIATTGITWTTPDPYSCTGAPTPGAYICTGTYKNAAGQDCVGTWIATAPGPTPGTKITETCA